MESMMKFQPLSTLALVTSLSMAIVTPANATEGWVLAADSAEGNTRYFVNTGEFNYTINKHGAHVFSIPVRMANNGKTQESYAVIDATGCIENGGDLIITDGHSTNKYWWSPEGSRMYDSLGGKICEIGTHKAANNTLIPGGKVKPTASKSSF
jgi:hypothetical protein